MCIPRGRLHLGVTEQLVDHRSASPEGLRAGREAVAASHSFARRRGPRGCGCGARSRSIQSCRPAGAAFQSIPHRTKWHRTDNSSAIRNLLHAPPTIPPADDPGLTTRRETSLSDAAPLGSAFASAWVSTYRQTIVPPIGPMDNSGTNRQHDVPDALWAVLSATGGTPPP